MPTTTPRPALADVVRVLTDRAKWYRGQARWYQDSPSAHAAEHTAKYDGLADALAEAARRLRAADPAPDADALERVLVHQADDLDESERPREGHG